MAYPNIQKSKITYPWPHSIAQRRKSYFKSRTPKAKSQKVKRGNSFMGGKNKDRFLFLKKHTYLLTHNHIAQEI